MTESISDVKCVHGVHHFSSSVLMSIELQQTIGYGQRATSGEVSIYIPRKITVHFIIIQYFSVLDCCTCPRFPVNLRPSPRRGPHRDLLRQDSAAWQPGRDLGLEQERRGEPQGRGAVPCVAGEAGHGADDGHHFHFSRSLIFSNHSC